MLLCFSPLACKQRDKLPPLQLMEDRRIRYHISMKDGQIPSKMAQLFEKRDSYFRKVRFAGKAGCGVLSLLGAVASWLHLAAPMVLHMRERP